MDSRKKTLVKISVFTITTAITSTSLAQQSFDLLGVRTGMSSTKFVELAEGISDGRGVKDSLRVFSNQDGEEIPETVHNVKFTFRAEEDRSTFIATPARKPMKETIYSVSRSVSYNSLSVGDRPSLPDFTKALNEKYGEPHNVEKQRLSQLQRNVTLYFSDGEIKGHCPDGTKNYQKSASGERPFIDCPATLKIQLRYWEQSHQPVETASFEMIDHDIRQQDTDNFDPYWSQWMEDYIESNNTGSGGPRL